MSNQPRWNRTLQERRHRLLFMLVCIVAAVAIAFVPAWLGAHFILQSLSVIVSVVLIMGSILIARGVH